MMKYYLLCFFLCLSFGCSRVQVSQDYDAGVSFSQFHSYAWGQTEVQQSNDVRITNPLLHKRIRTAIDQIMAYKGFSLSETPDLFLQYDYAITTKIETSPFSTGVGYGIGSHGRYGGVGIYSTPEINQYDVGILTIDMFAMDSSQMVWRGRGSEIVPAHPSPEQTTEMVQRVVYAILKQFPPTPAQ